MPKSLSMKMSSKSSGGLKKFVIGFVLGYAACCGIRIAEVMAEEIRDGH